MNQTDLQNALAAASQAQRAGRHDQAAKLCHEILVGSGEHPLALNILGFQALTREDFAAAAAMFRRATLADPNAPELHLNLARALRSSGDAVGEQAALEGALAIDQHHFMALVRLAELFERLEATAQAAERWSGVLALGVQMDERSPAIDEMLSHARSYVTAQQADFAAALDQGLADARSAIDGADRRRFDASIDHLLGRRQIYSNQCAGLHFPFLPADEFFDRRHFSWLEDIEAKTAIIRSECEALFAEASAGFSPYVAMPAGTPENKWSPLDHNLDWSAFHLWKNGIRDDAACARCPQTTAAIEALPLADLPARAPTVFFSVLRPETHLPAHTGVSNVRTIIHLPLIVPDGCRFRVGGETRVWRAGEAWAFDDTIEHEAWNESDQMRAILIFDVWNPHIRPAERALLRAFFPLADAHGYDSRAQITD
ncbi:hypothetical protein ASG11_01045 [Sphingomonas sp. Leaf357]|uniref:aspartyl/asparaginyl beta-hydroxylase domain-containing protein n=1 Tax=Sphingomonas sp. Leaf357 TaxID=1736350 RepID=UPI0006FF74DD|nr:aspartyl/asparaginyl beta-hydroxylase domain-containing protein [Sphingomonas sp. Leaf357]KQS03020.1 hypothetical protein ASG11_01045 [Sphingomonas sp. Leaf357]